MPLSFGLIMAGFAGHSIFPTLYRDMENPKQYTSVVNWCYVATAIVYFFVAACGYRMFGVDTLEEVRELYAVVAFFASNLHHRSHKTLLLYPNTTEY